MALLFVSMLKKEVKESGLNLSDEEIIRNLKQIRQGLLLMARQRSVIPMMEEMDNLQKKLYYALNLDKMAQ